VHGINTVSSHGVRAVLRLVLPVCTQKRAPIALSSRPRPMERSPACDLVAIRKKERKKEEEEEMRNEDDLSGGNGLKKRDEKTESEKGN